MTVYFDNRRGWGDYIAEAAAGLTGKYIDNQFDKVNKAREFERAQKAADAELARKKDWADTAARQLLGYNETRTAASEPGWDAGGADSVTSARIPGILSDFDMREAPSHSLAKLAAAGNYMTPEMIAQIGNMLASLNASVTPQEFNFGGTKKYGTLNPSTGRQTLAEGDVTLSPDVGATTDAQKYAALMGYKGDAARAGAQALASRATGRSSAPKPYFFQDTEGNQNYWMPGMDEAAPIGVKGLLPEYAYDKPVTVGEIAKAFPQFFDKYGKPLPGSEDAVAALGQAMSGSLGYTPPPKAVTYPGEAPRSFRTRGSQAGRASGRGQEGTPRARIGRNNVTQEQLKEFMTKTGMTREEAEAYLRKK